ncbi:hypothetical protein [Blautia sp.]|uniref:hypothetical protein n=1 Tax=Blautia sp. TaxID=1955243 RepID=UPI002584AD9E|nr:hypothetical protein [Blautia sp.]
MGYIQVRNMPEETICRLDTMAKKKGMSREQFLRERIKAITLETELKNQEDRFSGLVNLLVERLEENNQVMQEMVDCLERLEDYLEGRENDEDI